MSAMALGVAAAEATRTPPTTGASPLRATPPPRAGALSLVPHRVEIPDGYAVNLDTGPPMFVAPVDRNRMVALDLLGRERGGWTAEAAYDEEKRGPFQGTADVLRLVVEYHF